MSKQKRIERIEQVERERLTLRAADTDRHATVAELQRHFVAGRLTDADLGERIKRRRKELGLNQKATGEALGVTQAYISMLERGKIPNESPSSAFRKRLEAWLEEE